jgi:hypothetical protein
VSVVSPAGFSFSAVTAIPATEVDLAGPSGSTPVTPTAPGYVVCVRPMKATLESSVVTIEVYDDDHDEVMDLAADFSYAPVLASVPEAKWGTPLPDGSDPNPNALLDGRLLGIQSVTPKPPVLTPTGDDALAMDVETTFTYDTVDETSPDHLPLSVSATAPQAPPVVDPASMFTTVASTLTSPAVVTARDGLFTTLGLLGIDPGTNGDLTTFASQPGAYLTADPLLAAQP